MVGALCGGRHALSKSRIPDQRLDASGECLHLYLVRDGVCVHCGLRFELAWSSERGALLRPTRKNLAYAVGAGFLIAVSQASGQGLMVTVFLLVSLFFFMRTLLGSFELFAKHGFVPGKLGPLMRRGRFNLLVVKPYVTVVGGVRFPIDLETYERCVASLRAQYPDWLE